MPATAQCVVLPPPLLCSRGNGLGWPVGGLRSQFGPYQIIPLNGTQAPCLGHLLQGQASPHSPTLWSLSRISYTGTYLVHSRQAMEKIQTKHL